MPDDPIVILGFDAVSPLGIDLDNQWEQALAGVSGIGPKLARELLTRYGTLDEVLDAIDVVPTEYEYDEEIRVAVMGLSYTKHKPAVEKFLDFVEKHGKQVFADFGYKK